MTPPATATARSAARVAPGTRRTPVRSPRRISGPASPARAAATMPAPGIALPRRRPATQPRRRPARDPTYRRARESSAGIALRALGALEDISASALFDRLIRGRLWIGLLAFALIGMVAMQLLVLKLNTGIGHTLERVAQLQRANAQLGIENSTSSAESRIAPSATTAGMTLAPVGTVHFVAANRSDVARAASVLAAPIQASASTQSTETSNGASEQSGGPSEATPTEAGKTATSSSSSSSSSTTTTTSPSATVGGETGGSTESSSAGPGAPQGSAATTEAGGSAQSSGSPEGSVSISGPRE
jgi:hypothetical protein